MSKTPPDSASHRRLSTSCRHGGGSGASRTRPAQGKGASRIPAAGTAMPRRSAGHRTMVRRALRQRRLRAALRTRSLAQHRMPTRLSGASRTRPAQGKGASRTRAAGTAMPRRSAAPHANSAIWCFDSGCRYCDASAIGGPSYDGEACPSIQSLGAALAADEGCDGMTYTRNYAEGTPHECRCDSYCDDFCDDGPNGCARTCRILNGVFEHIPSVHAGDRTCTWYAHYVTNPINYEGYDCSWMTGTGEGGHGDDCQDWTSAGALKCREGNQNQNNCHF
ncbi:unnamed protein product [Prorocentrum cordatum]|uniref:Cellulase n=1 Tax=Prorocentrum cordatum TaxID=2364126 RepID=A0ABN9RUE0_9DINO|nr:unnamed protein product [Polarella glacialis]